MKEVFIVRSATDLLHMFAFGRSISFKRPWKVIWQEIDRVAGVDQEAVLRGKERKIAQHTGQDPDEVHEEMLIRHYGSETVDLGNGVTWTRPARRTRTGPNPLTRSEMVEHTRYVEAFAASFLGIVV